MTPTPVPHPAPPAGEEAVAMHELREWLLDFNRALMATKTAAETDSVLTYRVGYLLSRIRPQPSAAQPEVEDVERVARAMRKHEWGEDNWDDTEDSDRDYWRQSATAAIAALA